jgi:hypothetical protein
MRRCDVREVASLEILDDCLAIADMEQDVLHRPCL